MVNRLVHIIENPTEVEKSDLSILKKSIEQYPYFYQLKALHLFALQAENHPSYEDFLHTTSIYSPNRADLYNYLHQPKKVVEEIVAETKLRPIIIEKAIASEPIDLTEETEIEIQDELEPLILENSFGADFEQEVIEIEEQLELQSQEKQEDFLPENDFVEHEDEFLDEENLEEISIEEVSEETHQENLPRLVEEKISVNKSFNDWLKISKSKPEEIKEKIIDSKKEEKLKLIDTFLENSPKITPLEKDYQPNNTKKIIEEPQEFSELMTETLAQIYTEQNKYDKAIRAYKILCLKYPEKNAYFADRIREIENLKNKK